MYPSFSLVDFIDFIKSVYNILNQQQIKVNIILKPELLFIFVFVDSIDFIKSYNILNQYQIKVNIILLRPELLFTFGVNFIVRSIIVNDFHKYIH